MHDNTTKAEGWKWICYSTLCCHLKSVTLVGRCHDVTAGLHIAKSVFTFKIFVALAKLSAVENPIWSSLFTSLVKLHRTLKGQ